MPALTKSTSMRPCPAFTRSTSVLMAATSPASETTTSIPGNSVLALSTDAWLEPVTTTLAPSDWKSRAVAAPMPLVPPEMRAILPSSFLPSILAMRRAPSKSGRSPPTTGGGGRGPGERRLLPTFSGSYVRKRVRQGAARCRGQDEEDPGIGGTGGRDRDGHGVVQPQADRPRTGAARRAPPGRLHRRVRQAGSVDHPRRRRRPRRLYAAGADRRRARRRRPGRQGGDPRRLRGLRRLAHHRLSAARARGVQPPEAVAGGGRQGALWRRPALDHPRRPRRWPDPGDAGRAQGGDLLGDQ